MSEVGEGWNVIFSLDSKVQEGCTVVVLEKVCRRGEIGLPTATKSGAVVSRQLRFFYKDDGEEVSSDQVQSEAIVIVRGDQNVEFLSGISMLELRYQRLMGLAMMTAAKAM